MLFSKAQYASRSQKSIIQMTWSCCTCSLQKCEQQNYEQIDDIRCLGSVETDAISFFVCCWYTVLLNGITHRQCSPEHPHTFAVSNEQLPKSSTLQKQAPQLEEQFIPHVAQMDARASSFLVGLSIADDLLKTWVRPLRQHA